MRTVLAFAAVLSFGAQAQYTVAPLVRGRLEIGMAATSSYVVHLNGGLAGDAHGGFYLTSENRVIHVNKAGLVDLTIGNGQQGLAGDGGPSTAANVQFATPSALAVAPSGNLYIAELGNSRVRKVDVLSGSISTFAGNGHVGGSATFTGDGGLATNASLGSPTGLAVDSNENVYIADSGAGFYRVRKVAAGTGIITTVAGNGSQATSGNGGLPTSAGMDPFAIVLDSVGNLYIADETNAVIRKISAATGLITTFAGNGTFGNSGDGGLAVNAAIGSVNSIAVDASGQLYLSSGSIRVVATSGIIGTFAAGSTSSYSGEGGPVSQATLPSDGVLAFDANGNMLYGDYADALVLRIESVTTIVTTVAGTTNALGDNGPATLGQLVGPHSMAVDSAGNVFVADGPAKRVRKISASSGLITTFAGNGNTGHTGDGGLAVNASFSYYAPDFFQVAVDPSGNLLLSDDLGWIRQVSAQTGIIKSIAAIAAPFLPSGMLADNTGIYFGDNAFYKVDPNTGVVTIAASPAEGAQFDRDASGNFLAAFPFDIGSIPTGGNGATVIAGGCNTNGCPDNGSYTGAQLGDGGPALSGTLNHPQGVKLDSAGNLYIADFADFRLREVSAKTGYISTVAGTNVPGCSGGNMAGPSQIGLDGKSNIYVLDTICKQVFKLSLAPQYIGSFDSGNCQTVTGWAADRNQLNLSIYVSVYDGATMLTTLTANQPRPDIGASLGDNGLHGFGYSLPASVRDGNAHTIHIYFGTSTNDLSGSPKSLSCGGSPNFAGSLEVTNCQAVSGWAADKNSPSQPISVSVYDGARLLTTITANVPRADIAQLLGDNGQHGFIYLLPANVRDGAVHAFHVFYESTNSELNGSPKSLTCGASTSGTGLAFYPMAPCRVADTRPPAGFSGQFGPPSMTGGQTRTFNILSSSCAASIPSNVAAYALNFTVVPPSSGPPANLTTWPTGAGTMPNVSTLNYSSSVVANAAIVPAGTNGAINVFANYPTGVLFDLNGYFAPPTSSGLELYSLSPCRIADTRPPAGFSGQFGPPSLSGGQTRTFNILASSCTTSIPSTVAAYSLNFTVVPNASDPPANLTTWPTGASSMPNTSTLNYSTAVVADAAIVPAGTNEAINVFANYPTDVLFDINGYFAPPTTAGLHFYPVTPCRIADTRAAAGFTGQFGAPTMTGGSTRTFNVPASGCGIPSTAVAYSLNFTVAPPSGGPGANLTTWPTGGPMPNVSTLNYYGYVVANAAIVPAGTNGSISVFVNYTTDVLFDINGYFAP